MTKMMAMNRNSFLYPYASAAEFDSFLGSTLPRTEVFVVDAALARHILAITNNENNRNLRHGRVKKYARMMLANKFHRSPQGIVIGADRTLQNGQHRLNGVVEASKSNPDVRVPFEVRFGEPPVTCDFLDDVAPRSTTDRLVMAEGLQNAGRLKSAALAISWLVFGKKHDGDFDIDQFRELRSKMPAAFAWAPSVCYGKGAVGLAGVTAGLMLAYVVDPAAVETFADQLKLGVGLGVGDPAYSLREFAMRYRKGQAVSNSVSLANKTCAAIKACMEGKRRHQAIESREAVDFFARANGLIDG
jgi:hypothetical protein